ncbi:hypothetical protein DPMN_128809 [Dreissena polymorpha]|uniref:Uncharacterized protein n=1 Tax=Dreissena polymorpha TaxID=45954 RepID=A0A9D4JZZ6_DREPO|nr:hypothetical protein DPMN_128809 [Dreissena polymorpha]
MAYIVIERQMFQKYSDAQPNFRDTKDGVPANATPREAKPNYSPERCNYTLSPKPKIQCRRKVFCVINKTSKAGKHMTAISHSRWGL